METLPAFQMEKKKRTKQYVNVTLKRNIESARVRIHKTKKASLIILDGYQGEGKSTLAVQLAEEYQGFDLDFAKQYAVGGDEFKEKFELCITHKLPTIIYDEAGDFDKYSVMSRFNKTMAQFLKTFRVYKILVIVILPFFNDLDPRLFANGIPRLMLHCHGKTETKGFYSAYGLWRMSHIRKYLKNNSNKILDIEVYKFVRPNFRGEFYDLPEAKRLELDKLSTAGKEDIRTKGRINQEGLKSVRDIAESLGRSIIWVKKELGKAKYKPAMYYKRANYYEAKVIDSLEKKKKR